MSITAIQMQAAVKRNRPGAIKAMYDTLVDFGYTSLSMGTVEAAIASWEAHEEPKGVIAMFVHGWLNDGKD